MTEKTKWVIDPAHSEIEFKIKHLMISWVKGSFKKFEGEVLTNGDDFTDAEVDVRVAVDSIATSDDKRDGHLRSAEFFDVEKYKQITFGGIVERSKKGTFELWGDLTIKDVSKRVQLDVVFGGIAKDPWGKEKAGFTLTGKINRKDWKLEWNTPLDGGGVMLGDDVLITCDIELVKTTDQKEALEEKAAEDKNITA